MKAARESLGRAFRILLPLATRLPVVRTALLTVWSATFRTA